MEFNDRIEGQQSDNLWQWKINPIDFIKIWSFCQPYLMFIISNNFPHTKKTELPWSAEVRSVAISSNRNHATKGKCWMTHENLAVVLGLDRSWMAACLAVVSKKYARFWAIILLCTPQNEFRSVWREKDFTDAQQLNVIWQHMASQCNDL